MSRVCFHWCRRPCSRSTCGAPSSTTIEKPDGITFDLDPDAAVGWPEVVSSRVRGARPPEESGAEQLVKTTGGKGLHVYAPLKPHADWAAVKEFAHALAKAMAKDSPRKYLATASKKARSGRIFVDYLRNGRGATAVAAYSARARAGATVSTPLAWDELGPDMRSDRFTIANLLHRLSRGRRSLEGRAQSRQTPAVQAALKPGTLGAFKRFPATNQSSSTIREPLKWHPQPLIPIAS